MASGAPAHLVRFDASGRLVTWEAAGEDCRIVCPEALLESIRRESALAARGPVPLGMGGALLGEISGGTYRIRAWHPIPCRHQRGPSFLLSKDEVAGLKEFLSQLPARSGSSSDQIVGWFVSHPHSGASLRDDEISLHQRFFRARDLFLLLEIEPGGAARITVHRGAVPLEPRWRVIPAPALRRGRGEARGASADLSPGAGAPAAEVTAAGRGPRGRLGLALASVLLLTILGSALYLGRNLLRPAPPPPLRALAPLTTPSLAIEKRDRGYLLRWNAQDPSLVQARRVILSIADDGQVRDRVLSRDAILAGSLFHVSDAQTLEAELRLEFPDGSVSRERVRYQP
jgi:hypothetical protein